MLVNAAIRNLMDVFWVSTWRINDPFSAFELRFVCELSSPETRKLALFCTILARMAKDSGRLKHAHLDRPE